MILSEFYRATAGLPGSSEIQIMAPWGEIQPAIILNRETLAPGDPILENLSPSAVILTATRPDPEA